MKKELSKLAKSLLADNFAITISILMPENVYRSYVGPNEWLTHMAVEERLTMALLILESENYWD